MVGRAKWVTKSGAKPWEGAVVATVTVTLCELELNVTWLGETVHMESAGAPVQLRLMARLNPAEGARASV
jgi:hypothetical protein